ncbi:citramalyl-CoA lyase, mitochondrial isoform X2 [Hyalella azteca]|uniref:Citramalyl-CoA lyase, mitochondrial n=1 Tax=Hyalella azteca TaxID=294128 RepID=A0A8B7PBJ6_HYAAZ|nr:citramalyl-CoA lyase, mitochondrial isoform X2 [Hyalella azteca]
MHSAKNAAAMLTRTASHTARTVLSKFYSSVATPRYVPRRAVMYVPGSDQRKIDKVAAVAADCVVLDCEDGVALNQKEAARNTIRATLEKKRSLFAGKDCSVRVNAVSSDLWKDDLASVLASQHLPTTLHLPKVDSTRDIDMFASEVVRLLEGRHLEEPLRVFLFCESGRSLLRLAELCEHGLGLPPPLLLDGFVFGSDDYCADIGMTRSSLARELLYARQKFVSVVRSFRLQAIDLVYIDYKNLAGLERQSVEGAEFGFTGKQVIHPCQVDIVQRAFSPSPKRVQWARGLLEAYEKHQTQGAGAFTYQGSMIDMPLVLQARNVIATSAAQSSSTHTDGDLRAPSYSSPLA